MSCEVVEYSKRVEQSAQRLENRGCRLGIWQRQGLFARMLLRRLRNVAMASLLIFPIWSCWRARAG